MGELIGCLEQWIRVLEIGRNGMLALHNHLQVHLIRRRYHSHRPGNIIAKAGQVILVLIPFLPNHQLIHTLFVAPSAGIAVIGKFLEGHRIHFDYGPGI